MEKDTETLAIVGATIIDGNGGKPLEAGVIVIQGKKIVAIGDETTPVPRKAKRMAAGGKYAIPGLMNANVHLFGAINMEGITRYTGRYEEIIAESAQVALKNGLTTVFDTLGPRRFLMKVRDEINEGRIPGSRIFCAGNIVGMDGPFSSDFFPKAEEVASAELVRRINAIWVENVGRHLMWHPPERVADEVRAYIKRGIDFVKYASNDHWPGAFLAFSPQVQAAIVGEAHRAGITAQAHTLSVEGLRIAAEAGCDVIQHANITGPVQIPSTTLDLLARARTGVVVFPFTKSRFDLIMRSVSEIERNNWRASDANAINLIRSDVTLLLANDGAIMPREWASDPQWGISWITAPGEDNLSLLDTGHFAWLKAMEEKGCRPMEMLKAATRNIAVAYGKEKDLGSLEPGKIADVLVLDGDPLQHAANYRKIHCVIKEGVVVDRDALPRKPVLTAPPDPPQSEETRYVPFISPGTFPICPMCMVRR